MSTIFHFFTKKSLRSRDIQIVFKLYSVGHYFRGWSKINLNVYHVSNCPNKNSITHSVWYLEKKKRYDSETLSINKLLNKKNFYGITQNSQYMKRNSFKNNSEKKISKEGYQKALKNVSLFFFFRAQSLLMDKIVKNKRGLEPVTSRFRLQKSSEKCFY